MDGSEDEFDAYDLSEFSAADFVHIDCMTKMREHDQQHRDALWRGYLETRHRVLRLLLR
jgi:hypothetical protein